MMYVYTYAFIGAGEKYCKGLTSQKIRHFIEVKIVISSFVYFS